MQLKRGSSAIGKCESTLEQVNSLLNNLQIWLFKEPSTASKNVCFTFLKLSSIYFLQKIISTANPFDRVNYSKCRPNICSELNTELCELTKAHDNNKHSLSQSTNKGNKDSDI